jgi:hypothetical protein
MNTWTLRRGYPILVVDPPPPSSAAAAAGKPPKPAAGAGGVAVSQLPFHAPRSFEVGVPYTSVRPARRGASERGPEPKPFGPANTWESSPPGRCRHCTWQQQTDRLRSLPTHSH